MACANQLITLLLEGLSELYEADYGVAALDALSTLFAGFRGALSGEVMAPVYALLPSLLEMVMDNLAEAEANHAKNADEAGDEDDETSGFVDSADEEEVLYAWGRLQATLFESFPQAINEHGWVISEITGRFGKVASASSGKKASSPLNLNEAYQHAALGVLCDWVIWCGGAGGAVAHGQALIDTCLMGITSGRLSALAKQTATHLAGLMASKGGPAFADFCVQAAAPALIKLINKADAQAPSQLAITDNAVSSLIRIHQRFPLAASDASLVSEVLLPALPVVTDDAEVGSVVQFVLDSGVGDARVKQRMGVMLSKPEVMLQLSPTQRERLEKFLN